MTQQQKFTLTFHVPCCDKIHVAQIDFVDKMQLTTCKNCNTRYALIPADDDKFNLYRFQKIGSVELPSSVKEKKQLYRFFS